MEQVSNIQTNQETDALIHKRLTETPTVNAPSISSSAMLVQLNILIVGFGLL